MLTPSDLTIEVTRCKDAIFVPLPPELRQPISCGCSCDFCTAHPERVPSWDTMAVGTKASKSDFTWLVHYPALSVAPDCVPA
jgi:hypothetical protein